MGEEVVYEEGWGAVGGRFSTSALEGAEMFGWAHWNYEQMRHCGRV